MIQSNPQVLQGLLACPHCRKLLDINVDKRICICPEHGEFPFAGPLPSFISGHDPAFEDHWDRNSTSEMSAEKLTLATNFLQPLKRFLPSDRPAQILDAGCGEGAHMAALYQTLGRSEDKVVGLDIATTALREASRYAKPDWPLIHGDMMALPFANESFDAVYSFGVLALTPDPKRALSEMARVLRPGGLLGLWVFPGDSTLIRIGLQTLRGLCRALGPNGATIVANAIVPFYGLVPTRSGLSLANANWRQTREVLMSNLTPPYLHFLDRSTVQGWLDYDGIKVVAGETGEPLTLWGLKH